MRRRLRIKSINHNATKIFERHKADDKIYVCKKLKCENSIDLDKAAHHDEPFLDLSCLQIQLFSILMF